MADRAASHKARSAELRGKSDDELGEELLTLRREQFNLRMQQATGQLARPDQYGKVRRDIARLKTIMREKVSEKARDVKGRSE